MKWMNGKELLDSVKDFCELIAGSAMNESAKTLGFSAMANGTLIKPVVNTTATQIIQFPGVSAAEAYAVGGTIATGAATSTAANLTLVNTTAGATAAGTSSVAGVISVAAPIALSALAAVGGFLIGNEVYDHNQEFFDDLLGPVMTRLADGTVNMMGLYDKNGITYLDKQAYELLKAQLDSIPNKVEFITSFDDINLATLKPTCKLYLPTIDGLNWQISNGYNRNAESSFYNYAAVAEAIEKSCEWIEGMFPDKLIALSAGYETFSDGRFTNAVKIRFYVFEEITSYSFMEQVDSYGITRHFLRCACKYYMSWIYAMIVMPASFIFSVNEPQHGTLNYYCENYDGTNFTGSLITESGHDFPLEPVDTSVCVTNFSYIEKSGLPNGVKKYKPNISHKDPLYLVRGWDKNGRPIEVPYIPVRLPSNPSEAPNPNEEDDPSGDPEENPNIVTPYIPTEVPYPSTVPIISPKPAPTPEENPDNLPYKLPNPIPDTNPEPAVEPNPNIDPSIKPEPSLEPSKIPVNDPVTNPESSGTTPPSVIPTIPTISSSASGLLHVYNPTNAQINEFGSWLWTTFSGDLIDTISKLFNNPMDGVIGVHELYATPSTSSESTIKCGFLDSGVTSRLVDKRYTEINCGSIIVPEHWGNYLDYAPYTKAHCYLPFIGMVELNADDIVGHAVNITYKIDAYTGACIAVITVASSGYESICYQFPGNCAVEIPITSGMKSVLQSALIGAATTAIGAAVGGAAGAALGSASAGTIASTAATRGGAGAITGAAYGARAKNDVQHSGSFGSSFGAMGCKKPFLVIKRPKQKVVAGYNKNYGYPAHKMVTIGECSGYLRAREVDVVSVTATEDEKRLIEEALKSGVFVS